MDNSDTSYNAVRNADSSTRYEKSLNFPALNG